MKIKLNLNDEEVESQENIDDSNNYDKGYENGYNSNPDDLHAKGYSDAENGEEPNIPGLINKPTTKYQNGYNEGLSEKYMEGYNDAKVDMGGNWWRKC